PARQQTPRPLHLARPEESRWPMEAVRPGPQHRETRPLPRSGIDPVSKRRLIEKADNTNPINASAVHTPRGNSTEAAARNATDQFSAMQYRVSKRLFLQPQRLNSAAGGARPLE